MKKPEELHKSLIDPQNYLRPLVLLLSIGILPLQRSSEPP